MPSSVFFSGQGKAGGQRGHGVKQIQQGLWTMGRALAFHLNETGAIAGFRAE